MLDRSTNFFDDDEPTLATPGAGTVAPFDGHIGEVAATVGAETTVRQPLDGGAAPAPSQPQTARARAPRVGGDDGAGATDEAPPARAAAGRLWWRERKPSAGRWRRRRTPRREPRGHRAITAVSLPQTPRGRIGTAAAAAVAVLVAGTVVGGLMGAGSPPVARNTAQRPAVSSAGAGDAPSPARSTRQRRPRRRSQQRQIRRLRAQLRVERRRVTRLRHSVARARSRPAHARARSAAPARIVMPRRPRPAAAPAVRSRRAAPAAPAPSVRAAPSFRPAPRRATPGASEFGVER
jgi:hypothetical protein